MPDVVKTLRGLVISGPNSYEPVGWITLLLKLDSNTADPIPISTVYPEIAGHSRKKSCQMPYPYFIPLNKQCDHNNKVLNNVENIKNSQYNGSVTEIIFKNQWSKYKWLLYPIFLLSGFYERHPDLFTANGLDRRHNTAKKDKKII